METEIVSLAYLEEIDKIIDRQGKGKRVKETQALRQKSKKIILHKEPCMKLGQVAVARYFYGKPLPIMENFENIELFSSAKGFGSSLSPFSLKNADGCIVENVWQFSKLYPKVTAQNSKSWKHPTENHADVSGNPTKAYWMWREKGMKNFAAVRYPNGKDGRASCICSIMIKNGGFEKLSYIEARKRIYCTEIAQAAQEMESFQRIQSLINQGVNVQLIEYDGPDPSWNFAPYNEVTKEHPGLIISKEKIQLLLNDSRKPFGHGYVIAALLLGGREWLF